MVTPSGYWCAGGAAVARILEPHAVARVDQEPRDKIERLLDTGDDRDLLGLAARTPCGAEVRGHRVAKGPMAEGLAPQQQPGGGPPQHPPGDLRPERRREQLERGQVGAEGAGPPRLEDREGPH